MAALLQGGEAAERLMQMLAEADDAETCESGAAETWESGATGSYNRTPHKTTTRSPLESVSENAAFLENGRSCSMSCDSSAIQRGGASGAGSLVELHSATKVQDRDKYGLLLQEDNTRVDVRDVLDFSLERSRSASESGRSPPDAAVESDASAAMDSTTHVSVCRGGTDSGARDDDGHGAARNAEDTDVLSKLLQKGRQMLNKLDRLSQSSHTHAQESADAAVASDVSKHSTSPVLEMAQVKETC